MAGLNAFYRGDTVTFTVTIQQNGSAVNITGDTVEITLRKGKTETDALLNKEAVLSDPTNGVATFTLTPTNTDLEIGRCFYDIQWTTAAGAVRTLMFGEVTVLQDITTD